MISDNLPHTYILNFGQFSAGWATYPLRKKHRTPLECRSLDRRISIDIPLLRSVVFFYGFLASAKLAENT